MDGAGRAFPPRACLSQVARALCPTRCVVTKMPPGSTSRLGPSASIDDQEREALHARCGVYTSGAVVSFLLDRRVAVECSVAVEALLVRSGLSADAAIELAATWVSTGGFLLERIDIPSFTHVVGNPPYIRWSKIPADLRFRYEGTPPSPMARGDLFDPFLDRALELLEPGGRCAFVCSDRWRFAAFAEAFRTKWISRLRFEAEVHVRGHDAFERKVGVYATAFVARKLMRTRRPRTSTTRRVTTLREAGFVVRVGPALGHAPALVLTL